MLGHKVFQTLSSNHQNVKCTIFGKMSDPFYSRIDLFRPTSVIEKIDVMDYQAVERVIRDLRPDFLVNCVGIIKQRDEANQAIPSITINSLLPHRLASTLAEYGGRLIHISTDCVFSGKRGMYTEEDPSDAEDLYGKTKALGEVTGANCLTLRTSIIGRELSQFRSLLEWFLAQKGRSIRGYQRVIYSGVTTNYLSSLIERIISDNMQLQGLYQVVSPPITKYDLLCLLREAYYLDVDIVPDSEVVSDRSMIGEKFLRATGFKMPTWPELAAQLAKDPTPYEKWRDVK